MDLLVPSHRRSKSDLSLRMGIPLDVPRSSRLESRRSMLGLMSCTGPRPVDCLGARSSELESHHDEFDLSDHSILMLMVDWRRHHGGG